MIDRLLPRGAVALLGQCGLVLTGPLLLHAVPPAHGRMLLLPLTQEARRSAAAIVIDRGARIVAAGPWAGSLVIDGRRDRLAATLLRHHILPLSARSGGCEETAA